MGSTRTMLLVAALALMCASTQAASGRMLIEGGYKITVNGKTFYVNPPQKADTCTNVAPDERYTCDQQKGFGACNTEFMKKGNYCLYTCGRCPSSPTPSPSGGNTSSPAPPSSPSKSGGGGGSSGGGGFAPPGNPTVCDDIAPNAEYTCAQQRDFGKCREWYILDNHFCAKTCGLAPCPPVANLPVRNGTSTSISRRQPHNNTAIPTTGGVTIQPEAGPTPIVTATPITVPPLGAAVENTTAAAAYNTEATASNVTGAVTNVTEAPANATVAPGVVAPTVAAPVVVAPAPVTTEPTPAPAPAPVTTAPAPPVTTAPAPPVTTAPVVVAPVTTAPTTTTTPPAVPAASPNLTEPTTPVIPAAEPPAAEPGLPAMGNMTGNATVAPAPGA